MIEVCDAAQAVPGPATSFAAGVAVGYTAATLQRAVNTYSEPRTGIVGESGFFAAGAAVVEEYVGGDPAAFTGYVSGAGLAAGQAGSGGDAGVEELLEPAEGE